MRHFKQWSLGHRLFAASVLTFGCICGMVPWKLAGQESKTQAPPPAPVKAVSPATAVAIPAEPPKAFTAPCSVHTEFVFLRASRDGVIKISCNNGEHVKKGELLAQFEVPGVRAAVTQAEVRLEKDQRFFNLMEKSKSAVSSTQLEEAKANVQIDQAQLEARQQELNATLVVSPADGVFMKGIHDGTFVSKGDQLFDVVCVDAPDVSCKVRADLYPQLRIGKTVFFKTSLYPRPFTGRISFILPEIISGEVQIDATLEDPSHQLVGGMQGELSVPAQATKDE